MNRDTFKVYAGLAIACVALALSICATVRRPSEAKPAGPHACIDQVARAHVDKLRRTLAEHDGFGAPLAQVVNGPAGAAEQPAPATPPDSGPRRYVHFEIPSEAISVTQKDDGTYDIRTSDPALAGSVMQVTAVTQSGEADKLLIRIPL